MDFVREKYDDHKKLCWCGWVLCAVGAILFVALMIASFKNIQHDEYGVEYYKMTMTLEENILEEGKHYVVPPTEMIIVPKLFESLDFTIDGGNPIECISKNGIFITLEITSQYRVIKEEIITFLHEFGDYDNLRRYFVDVTRTAVKDACSQFSAEDFILQRGEFDTLVTEYVKDAHNMSDTHVSVGFVQVRAIHHPGEFLNATQAKQVVNQQIDVALNARAQRLTDEETRLKQEQETAKGVVISARAKADGILSVAQAIASTHEKTWRERATAFALNRNQTGLGNEELLEYIKYIVAVSSSSPIIKL